MAKASGREGGASSLHFHEGKHNTFIVQWGTVEIWGEHTRLAILHAGSCFVTPAGVHHRMVFATDASLFELYYPVEGDEVHKNDIVRLAPGWTPEDAPVKALRELRASSRAGEPACSPG